MISHKLLSCVIFQNNLDKLFVTTFSTTDSKYLFEPCNFIYSNDLVVNFDNVKSEFCKSLDKDNTLLCSVDTILYNKQNGRLILVEFKNGIIDKNQRRKLKNKIKDSILMLNYFLSTNLGDSQNNFEFILVYNSLNDPPLPDEDIDIDYLDNPEYYDFAETVSEFAGEEHIRFNLGIYEDIFVKNVHTYNIDQFKKYYINFISNEN
ncbi:hypothetical protein HPA05_04345 [Streptococcus suis]|nr:hypothetical protein [Streptococcus suis]